MRKNKITYLSAILLAAAVLTGCSRQTEPTRGGWAKGADLSWLSEMEHDGVKFYHVQSDNVQCTKEGDCLDILQELGMNSVRLRVWVNHSTQWSNIPDMLSLAHRAADKGLRLMIDIHYSDFFADPSHQTTPAAWAEYGFEEMCEAVRSHTVEVLQALRDEGIEPEWVQIGNETPNGILWPMGKVQKAEGNWEQYAAFTRIGYEAAKEVFPEITVIVHVDNAYERRDWFWEQMEAYGGKWDMIGLSHYPMMSAWNGGKSWQEMNDSAEVNIRRLIRGLHCPVMVAEIGTFANDTLSEAVMADFVRRAAAIDSCMGIFYWEPEVYGGWRPAEYIPLGWGSYTMGAFTPDGQPSKVAEILFADPE